MRGSERVDADTLPRLEEADWGGMALSLVLGLALSALVIGIRPQVAVPFGLSVLGSALLGSLLLPVLRRWKAGQVIREEGPQSHHKKRARRPWVALAFCP